MAEKRPVLPTIIEKHVIEKVIINNWLSTNGRGDVNCDGITNFNDYAVLLDWCK